VMGGDATKVCFLNATIEKKMRRGHFCLRLIQ